MIRDDITVCIPTVNRPQETAMALSSILGQTFKPKFVLIAYDCGHSEAMKQWDSNAMDNMMVALESQGIVMDMVINDGDHGIGQIKNFYIPKVKTKWYLQLEDDSWLSPDYIEKLVKSKAFVDPKTAGVAGVQLLPRLPVRAGWSDHDLKPQLDMPDVFNKLNILEDGVHYENKGQVYRYKNADNLCVPSECFIHTYMLRTSIIRGYGGWDLQFSDVERSFAFEEVDATYNLFMAGYNLYCVPSAEMWHFQSSNRSLEWRYDDVRIKEGYEAHEKLFIKKWKGRTRNAYSSDAVRRT